MSYWVEYRDETKMVGPHPAPVFCGIFSSTIEIHNHLPSWAKLRPGYKAYGCIQYYGSEGEGFYVYRTETNKAFGPLAVNPDTSLAEVQALDEVNRQAEVEQALVVVNEMAAEANEDYAAFGTISY